GRRPHDAAPRDQTALAQREGLPPLGLRAGAKYSTFALADQAVVVELPQFAAVAAVSLAFAVVGLVLVAHRDPVVPERPHFLAQGVVQLAVPLAAEEADDLGAAGDELVPVAPHRIRNRLWPMSASAGEPTPNSTPGPCWQAFLAVRGNLANGRYRPGNGAGTARGRRGRRPDRRWPGGRGGGRGPRPRRAGPPHGRWPGRRPPPRGPRRPARPTRSPRRGRTPRSRGGQAATARTARRTAARPAAAAGR